MSAKLTNDQRGATMIEFAISIGFFLFMLGGIVDLGVGMHHKSMLTHVSNEVARLISIRLVGASNVECPGIITVTIDNEGKNIADRSLGNTINTWEVNWRSPSATQAQTNPAFNLSISSKLPCFFLCRMLPNGMSVRSSIESTVNSPGLNCCGTQTTCKIL